MQSVGTGRDLSVPQDWSIFLYAIFYMQSVGTGRDLSVPHHHHHREKIIFRKIGYKVLNFIYL
jgi:hypothetical protein